MKNNFYGKLDTAYIGSMKSKFKDWLIAIPLLVVAFAMMGFWIELPYKGWQGVIGFIFFMPISVTIFQFAMTPFFRLTGTYQYLSPMMLVFGANDKTYDLHNGTPYDYLTVMRGTPPGKPAERKILAYHLAGFLEIIRRIESKELPETVSIQGTSYFFSEQSVKRMGFTTEPATADVKTNLYLNYIDLLWMYSYSKGKLTFPNMSNIKKAVTTGQKLVERKAYIQQLKNRLER